MKRLPFGLIEIRHPVSILACLITSIAIWALFHPGIMSLDSMYIYFDATQGKYYDLHPPFLSMIVSLFLRMGADLRLVTLTQILLGTFGLRKFILSLLQLSGTLTDGRDDLFVVFLLTLFFSPVTPAPVYFMTLWTDTWMSIALIWGLGFLADMLASPEEKIRWGRVVGYVFFVSFGMLVRYNALVTYPILAWLAARSVVTGPRLWRDRVVLILMPALVFGGVFLYQDRILKVERTHPEYASYALDLASMIMTDSSVCTDLYITSCSQVYHEFSKDFVVGDGAIDFTLNQAREDVYRPFLNLFLNPRLPYEFAAAARQHPLLLARVKLLNYMDYVSRDPDRYFYQDHYPKNQLEMVFKLANEKFAVRWFQRTDWVIHHPLFGWFSFVHLPWLLVNLGGLLTCLLLFRRHKHVSLLLIFLLVPASYYASYLVFFTASEFRFMYPSMILVQLIALTLTYSYLMRRFSPGPRTIKG
jgi:hypothetical protein